MLLSKNCAFDVDLLYMRALISAHTPVRISFARMATSVSSLTSASSERALGSRSKSTFSAPSE
jgi:hypothetical protein